MSSAMIVVCLVCVIKLCRGQMFHMNLIEPPENPGPGVTYQKAPALQSMSDYNGYGNWNKNGYRTYNKNEEPDLSDLDTTLTKLEKWEDFEEIAEEIAKKNRDKKHVNIEEDARYLSKWLKDLKEGHIKKENRDRSWRQGNPSPGMSMYWPEVAAKQENPVFPNQETDDKKAGPKISVTDVMNMAKQKMREAQSKMIPSPNNKPLPKKSEVMMDVAAADDGIGPHARRSLPYEENSFLAYNKGTTEVPYFGDETLLQKGSNNLMSHHSALRQGRSPMRTENGAPIGSQAELYPQMGGAPMPKLPRGPYPEMSPMAFLHQGGIPRRPSSGNGPMSAPQQGAFPQMGGGGPMPFHQQGDNPQMGGGGPMPFHQQGDNPQMGGGGPMPFSQQGEYPQMGGRGKMPFPQQGEYPKMGGGGPRPFPHKGEYPQMGGVDYMESPYAEMGDQGEESMQRPGKLPGVMPQMGGNGPAPLFRPGSAPHMGGNGPTSVFQPGSAPQTGGNGPMPFAQRGANPYTGGSARGPSQQFQKWPPPQMGSNGPMPAPQQGADTEVDDYQDHVIELPPPPPGTYVPRPTPEPFRMLPTKDDFNTPIKWVPMSSAKLEDGIAKVTDMDTGRNFNIVINGSIFVPIIDDSVIPTVAPPTTVAPLALRTTTENTAMKALLQFVTPEELTRNDWLGFDAALTREKAQQECDGGGCRARCHTQSCQSTCNGDTCSAGCIGVGCTSSCDGPGCLSMCIGDQCKASCNGQACDARCKGTDCKTDCKSFSCSYVTNGRVKSGGGTWDQHYPDHGPDQYADGPRNIKPPTNQLRMGPMYEEDYNMKSNENE